MADKQEVGVPAPKEAVKNAEHNVMEFLQHLSAEVKAKAPHLPPTISEKIDSFIRKHGNKHPETTK